MGDPLSVASGVVGILAASAQLIQFLYQLGSAIKDAADDAQAAATELSSITIVVQGLQTYVVGRVKASPQRLQLITVEHITATLTGCIVTFSDLDATLKSLHIDTGLRTWDRAKWYLKKDSVLSLIQRLQNHKATFTMMLNILQCTSLNEAEHNMDRLCDAVNEVLRTNQELSLRLRNIEDIHQISPQTAAQGSPDASAGAEVTSTRSVSSSVESRTSQPDFQDFGVNLVGGTTAFEEQLHRSRVYRHATALHSQSSLVSDARSTLAFSICSSLTLGDVSKISVYALPIYTLEISNPDCYMMTDEPTEAIPTDATPLSSKPARRTLTSWWKVNKQMRLDNRRLKAQAAESPVADHHPTAEGNTSIVGASIADDAPKVFGVPLMTSIRYANVAFSISNDEGGFTTTYGYVPIVVAKCGVYLKEKGTDSEYIFELSGSPIRVLELQLALNRSPRYGKGLDWTGYTVHDAANVLLRYLLMLPEPVIPLIFYDRFCAPIRELQETLDSDDAGHKDAYGATYSTLISELPSINRQLLMYLVDLLAVFAYREDINHMTTAKLAGIFQPAILGHPQHGLDDTERKLCRAVVTWLIEIQGADLLLQKSS